MTVFRELTRTKGTGDVALAGRAPGAVAWAGSGKNGQNVRYSITENGNVEIGTGLYSGNILQRSAVQETIYNGVHTTSGATPIPLDGGAVVDLLVTNEVTIRKSAFGQVFDVETEDPAEVVVKARTSPGGGVVFPGVAMPVLLQKAHLAFIGDSRTQAGYQEWYWSATKAINSRGFLVAYLGCGLATSTTTNGTLEYRVADKAIRWKAPGDAFGPWAPWRGAYEHKFQSASPDMWLKVRFTSAEAQPLVDETWEVVVSGNNRPASVLDGASTECAANFGLYLNEPAYLGAGGAHIHDMLEMLPWFAERAGGPGIDVIRIGTNDISSPLLTDEQILQDAYTLFDERRKLGRKLVICGENARWDFANLEPMTGTKFALLKKLNFAYRAYVLRHLDSCRYVDLFDLSYDPDFTDGRPKAGLLKDGVHDGEDGAYIFGNAIAEACKELGMISDPPPVELDFINGTDVLMLGSAGTAGNGTTGTIPSGWRMGFTVAEAGRTAAVTLVPNGSGRSGRRAEIVLTASAGSEAVFRIDSVASLVFATYGLAAPDALQVFSDFELVSGAVSVVETMVYMTTSNRRGQAFYAPKVGRSSRVSVPINITTETSCRCQAFITVPAGGSATIRLGSFGLRKAESI